MIETNKYLIFKLEDENYGLAIEKVKEVIQYCTITSLHEASSYLKGVINLRGKIIPIIDMRLKFGMQEKEYNERTIFIVVEIVSSSDVYHIGLAVDSVFDVVLITKDSIEKTPEIGFKMKNKYLYGIAQINNNMIMILNIDNILTTEDVVELDEKVQNI